MWGKLFYESPIDDLEINHATEEEISQKWLGGIKLVHNQEFSEELNASFPESRQTSTRRINILAEDLIKSYAPSKEKVAHFIFSHNMNVKSFADYIYSKTA